VITKLLSVELQCICFKNLSSFEIQWDQCTSQQATDGCNSFVYHFSEKCRVESTFTSSAKRVLAIIILSICLSVTTRYRFKPRWGRDSGFSTYDSVESLVSCEQISCRWVRRFPSNEGIKYGYLRNRYFTTIGSSSVKTVADRHRRAADELSRGTNIDDLVPQKWGVLLNFSRYTLTVNFGRNSWR